MGRHLPFRGVEKALYLRGRIRECLVFENAICPRKARISIEVVPKRKHEIDVLAHIAFESETVACRPLNPIANDILNSFLTQSLAFPRKASIEMSCHAIFKFCEADLRENCYLLLTNDHTIYGPPMTFLIICAVCLSTLPSASRRLLPEKKWR